MTTPVVTTTTVSNVPVQGEMLDQNGVLTQQWRLFFQNLYTRIGGQIAPSNSVLSNVFNVIGASVSALTTSTTANAAAIVSLAAIVNAPPGTVAPVVVGASPFTFTTAKKGALVISGGGLKLVEITRDGTNFYSTGAFRGMFPLSTNDSIRVTYLAASVPVLTFFPT